jgi:hypothetical protein
MLLSEVTIRQIYLLIGKRGECILLIAMIIVRGSHMKSHFMGKFLEFLLTPPNGHPIVPLAILEANFESQRIAL